MPPPLAPAEAQNRFGFAFQAFAGAPARPGQPLVLFLDDLQFALRISNGILLALLFFAGYHHARHTLARPWLAGLVFLLVGVLLLGRARRLDALGVA